MWPMIVASWVNKSEGHTGSCPTDSELELGVLLLQGCGILVKKSWACKKSCGKKGENLNMVVTLLAL